MNGKTTKWNERQRDGIEGKTDARFPAYLSPTVGLQDCVQEREGPLGIFIEGECDLTWSLYT